MPKVLFILIAIFSLGFIPEEDEPIERPIDPWVFRAVLDEMPGAVVVALHEHIWVAYNPMTADVYKVWRGKITLQGAVYTGIYGGQPTAEGFPFVVNDIDQASWEVKLNGKTERPKIRWEGYKVLDNVFTAMYTLTLSDGQVIKIEEQPEYVEVKRSDNRSSFQRTFTVTQAPSNAEISLALELDGMIKKSDIQSKSKFKDVNKEKRHFDWGTLYNFEGKLLLDQEEPTVLTLTFAIDPEKEAATSSQ